MSQAGSIDGELIVDVAFGLGEGISMSIEQQ